MPKLNTTRFIRQIKSYSLIAICLFPSYNFAQSSKSRTPQSQTVNQPGVITEDTVLSMRMNDSLTSKNSRVGDKFSATLTVPVYVDGRVAIPAGAVVEGKVTQVTPARRMNKGGTIGVEFEEITLPNGMSTKIDGVLTSDDPEIQKRIDEENRMSGGKSKDTGVFIGQSGAIGAVLGGITGGGKGAVVGGAVGAGVGLASVLFSKGEEASVPAGTTFGIRLKQALPVPDDVNAGVIGDPTNTQQDNSATSGAIDPGNTSGEVRARTTQENSKTNGESNASNAKVAPDKEAILKGSTPREGIENEPNAVSVDLPLSSPEMIRRAQQALKEKGYYEGEINGEMTPRTQNAIKTYQQENRLPETGLLDQETARNLRIIGLSQKQKSAQPPSPQNGSGPSSGHVPAQPNLERHDDSGPQPGNGTVLRQSATNIQALSANLLSEYQQMIGARMTDNGVEFENGNKHSDGDIDLLFALDSFANAAKLYNRVMPSLRNSSALRNATLSLAREARRTDKVFTTTSSRWTNELNSKWDNIRQEVLKIMYMFNIGVGELDN